MKKTLKKRMTQILMTLLAAAVIVGFVPQMGAPVYAADGDPGMVMGAESVLKATANTADAQKVWYAGKTWYVISFDGTGNEYTKPSGAMTLFSSGLLATNQLFYSDWMHDRANNYHYSILQNNTRKIYKELFSEKEQKAVNERTLIVDEYSGTYPYSTGVSEWESSDYLWALSTAEALALPSGSFRKVNGYWWLRSPGSYYAAAAIVTEDYVTYSGFRIDDGYGMRPAFDLNLSSVLFTSASSAKASSSTDADSLNPVGTNSTDEWGLTLKDDGTITGLDGHSNFGVSEIGKAENGATVTYTGAATGANEYISAIITDKPITDPSAKIIYYGRIKSCASDEDASGTATINTVGKLGESDTLYVFNEQYNGSNKTGFAGKLIEIEVPEKCTVKFVDGQGNTLKTEVLDVGESATAPEDPAREGYTFDGWDQDFTNVKADLTVTAKWNKNPEPESDPAPGSDPSSDPSSGGDPNQMGADGTAVGPGASAAAADKAITNMVSDDDPAGTLFGKLTLKSPKQTKSSIDLSWTNVPGATSYVLYGNKCGKGIKPIKLGVVNGTKQTVSTVANQKVAKGTYYKFIVVALDKDNKVISTSKVIHVATKGGKVGNHKKVTIKGSVIKKAKKLKKGKTLKLKAKAVPQAKKLKVKKHVGIRYESTDNNIATVSKKGAVKAKTKGTCYIYAYAQNGVFKKIKVTVK